MVMGSEGEVRELMSEGELYICPACGYTDGFHVSFQFADTGDAAEVYLICPSCHHRFRMGWTIEVERG